MLSAFNDINVMIKYEDRSNHSIHPKPRPRGRLLISFISSRAPKESLLRMSSARSALDLNEREYQEALLLSAAKGTDEIDFVARGTKVNDLMEPGCQSLFIGTINQKGVHTCTDRRFPFAHTCTYIAIYIRAGAKLSIR